MNLFGIRKKHAMPGAGEALPGRDTPMAVPAWVVPPVSPSPNRSPNVCEPVKS